MEPGTSDDTLSILLPVGATLAECQVILDVFDYLSVKVGRNEMSMYSQQE
jgi:hypothetical protein